MIFAVSLLMTKVSTLSAKLECLTSLNFRAKNPTHCFFFRFSSQKVCQLKGIEKKVFWFV